MVNAGIPGETTGKGRARPPELLDRVDPDLLIEGGNDFLRRLPEEETEENLAAMSEAARALGIPVVAVPRPGLLLAPHPLYRRLAERYRLPLEERALAEILADRALKSDPVHPNGAGYRRLAEAVCRLLRGAGAVEADRSCRYG